MDTYNSESKIPTELLNEFKYYPLESKDEDPMDAFIRSEGLNPPTPIKGDDDKQKTSIVSDVFSQFSFPGITRKTISGCLCTLEDLHLVMHSIVRIKNKYDFLFSGKLIYRLITNSNIIADALNVDFKKFFDNLFIQTQSEDEIENFFELMHKIKGNFDVVKCHPFYKKFYKFLLFCVTRGMLDKFGLDMDMLIFSGLEKKKASMNVHSKLDFLMTLFDLILYVSETGYACFKTKSLEPIYIGNTRVEVWVQTCLKLKSQSRVLSNPAPHGFTIEGFYAELDDSIQKGRAIIRFLPPEEKGDRRFLASLLYELENIKTSCITKRAASSGRKAPFSMLVYGSTSIGKTLFSHILFKHFAKLFDLPSEDCFKFTVNPLANFWDNFETYMWCLILDDIASLRPDAANGIDPSMETVIQAINNVDFVPDQADLDKKGTTPFVGKLVVATTNTLHLNSYAYFSCPIAVRRRFKFNVRLELKKCYATDGMLDASKLPPIVSGEYPDFWHIFVEKVVPSDDIIEGQFGRSVSVAAFDDIHSFLAWYSKEAISFDTNQNNAVKCDKQMDEIRLCRTCYLPLSKCSCVEMQSKDFQKRFFVNFFVEFAKRYAILSVIKFWLIFILVLCKTCIPFDQWLTRILFGTAPLHTFVDFKYQAKIQALVAKQIDDKIRKTIGYPKLLLSTIATLAVGYSLMKLVKSFNEDYDEQGSEEPQVVMEKEENPTCPRRKAIIWERSNPPPCNKFLTEELCDKFCCWDIKLKFSLAELPCNDGKFLPPDNHLDINLDDVGIPPKANPCEIDNVWKKNEHIVEKVNLTPQSISLRGKTQREVSSFFAGNCVSLIARRVVNGKVTFRKIKAFCIKGNNYITNYHFVRNIEDSFEFTIISGPPASVSTNINVVMHPDQFKVLPGYADLCSFELNCLPPRKDLSKYFMKEPYSGHFNGFYLSRSESGEMIAREVYHAMYGFKHDDYPDTMIHGRVKIGTENGDCSSVLVLDTPLGWCIAGFHVAWKADGNVVLAIPSDKISISSTCPVPGSVDLSAPGFERTLGPLNHKSPANFIEQGFFKVYGSYAGFRPKHKSTVTNTIIHDSLIKRGFKDKHGPPCMQGWEPWYKALDAMSKPVRKLDTNLLRKISINMREEMLSKFTKEDLSMVHVVDYKTAVNGMPGVTFVDSINKNTSMGNPWKKSKKFFLNPAVTKTHPHGVDFVPDVKQRIKNIIAGYKAGRRRNPIFCGHLKDEAVSFKKILNKKTRLFTGAPADWSVVVRMFTLGITRLFQNKKFISEMAVGTQSQTREWDRLFQFLTQHGPHRMVAGDYGEYDKRMACEVILEAFDIIIAICKAAGYSDEDLLVLEGIKWDTAFAWIDFDGDLMSFLGGNPSGHPLTVVINSLVNSIYMRYAYAILNPNKYDMTDFTKNVALMTYGDDNIMGVSEKCNWFNHTAIQKVFSSVGIKYTMADKEAESIPFIHISECTFLKRSWRYEPELNAHVCPLEKDSIYKSLLVGVRSKVISREQHSMEKIASAVREHFWHGKEEFNNFIKMIKEVIEENDLGYWITQSTFPTWIQLCEEFSDSRFEKSLYLQKQLSFNDSESE